MATIIFVLGILWRKLGRGARQEFLCCTILFRVTIGKTSIESENRLFTLLVFSSVKEGEDTFSRIGVALDSLGRQKPTPDSGSTRQHQLTSTSPELSLIGGASVPVFQHNSDSSEAQIPSELITSCVAMWLMIQMCTERQYPPSEVAQILDSAVRSLQPSCPQNLGVYREIQMSMGRIKTQILVYLLKADPFLHCLCKCKA
ncbi:hypothetical protein LguiB_021127 [Lonicera macranthoides]